MTTYTCRYRNLSVTLNPEGEALYQSLKALVMKANRNGPSDRIYCPVDERGAGIVDNYDNPEGCALFVTGSGRVIAHSCNFGMGVYVTPETAMSLAKRFFTTAGDSVIALIDNAKREDIAY